MTSGLVRGSRPSPGRGTATRPRPPPQHADLPKHGPVAGRGHPTASPKPGPGGTDDTHNRGDRDPGRRPGHGRAQLGHRAGLTGLVLLAALVYTGSCWWFPYAKCWSCHGEGKHVREDGKVLRLCRWCEATGRRLRLGRRVHNHYAATRAATRADTQRGQRRGGKR